MHTPKLKRGANLEATKKLSGTGQGMFLLLDKPTVKTSVTTGRMLRHASPPKATVYYGTVMRDKMGCLKLITTLAATTPTPTDAQRAAEREARRQGLRMLMGLNAKREGGPVDGLQFQEEQRAEW
ncbi:hypothetical protein ABT364_11760 [Massilia sp. SR12]